MILEPRNTYVRNHHVSLDTTNRYLVPLPVWLFLIGSLWPIGRLIKTRHFNLNQSFRFRTVTKRYWFPHHLTSLAISASVAMSILELIRLSISHQKYDALYFTPIGFGIALVMHYFFIANSVDGKIVPEAEYYQGFMKRGRIWNPKRFQFVTPNGIRLLAGFFWALELAFQIVKISVLAEKEVKATPDHPQYKRSDQILDLSILAGLQLTLLVLECIPGQGIVQDEAGPRNVVLDNGFVNDRPVDSGAYVGYGTNTEEYPDGYFMTSNPSRREVPGVYSKSSVPDKGLPSEPY